MYECVFLHPVARTGYSRIHLCRGELLKLVSPTQLGEGKRRASEYQIYLTLPHLIAVSRSFTSLS